MRWIGLTGCMGCGKSTVAKLLKEEHGLPVLSADEVALNLLLHDKDLHQFVQNKLGIKPPLTNDTDDSTDRAFEDFNRYRAEIASKIFGNAKLLESYEQYFHPKIKMKVQELKQELAKTNSLAFYDVPLLFEKKMQGNFDAIVGVFAEPDIQFKRLRERNHWSNEEIARRLKHQISNSEKIKQCDFVLTNNLDIEDLKKQVRQLVAKLTHH